MKGVLAMGNARIMVVEDEEQLGTTIKDMLENLGYNVPCIASSGDDAILKADLLYPDLVLMDMDLKGSMDGIEAASILREKFNLPVIYLFSHMDRNTIERAKYTLPECFLPKSLSASNLRNNVELALYKHSVGN
ncbi:response regulator [Methanohalophilus levihalophilus]|uniref:response regulator n=1 Tax=Methanohalophilus levihalophilus TaxID=1431282 RepID=UPI001FDA9E84|nr:response regulator [Methanohalophilus levihalophilus]